MQVIGQLLESALLALQSFVGDLRANHPSVFVALIVLGMIILAVSIWFGARGAARRSLAEARLSDRLPEELRGDPEKLRTEARMLAEQGRYLDAVRLVFRAAIIEQALREGILERLIDAEGFRRARTYRELIEEF